MHTWNSLAYHGDEWITAYSCIPAHATSAVWFSIGHAVELYLKAAHTKMFGDLRKAIQYGHRVKDLWDACKERDPEFMKDYEFRNHIFEMDFLDRAIFDRFSTADQKHYISYQALYVVFKHIQDLKYLGLPWKTRTTAPFAIACIHPDPIWTGFFKTLRKYLGHPQGGHADHLRQMLELDLLPENVAQYLRTFIT